MADYVVAYNSTSGFVYACWARSTSDNISTWKTDGFLTVDSVNVLEGLDGVGSDVETVLLTNPTDVDAEAPVGVFEVDSTTTPTDMTERGAADTGRNSKYDYTE